MNAWSNIQIDEQDPEIIRINALEKKLGELPDTIYRIRELITRFEVCHFKYLQHIKKIRDSIEVLQPRVDTIRIGSTHIRHGKGVIEKDATGRSERGMHYVQALRQWINEDHEDRTSSNPDEPLKYQVRQWLGDKDPDKIQLVRLLLARLTWDWTSYEQLLQGGAMAAIEQQAVRMDICHYAFPNNLDLLLKGIGQMRAVEEEKFEGCGSYNETIRLWLEKELQDLTARMNDLKEHATDRNNFIRLWLLACLAKTIKENIHSRQTIVI